MDLEQLKLILDAVGQMGAASQTAFVWWLIVSKVVPMVTWLVTFAGILWLAWRGIRTIHQCSEADAFAKEIREILIPDTYGSITPHEKQIMRKRLATLMGK